VILKVTLRNLAAHKLRLALTALAVILGVAFVAGTLVFTDTMGKQFDDLFAKTGQDVSVQVRAKKVIQTDDGTDTPTVPASVADTVGRVPGSHGCTVRSTVSPPSWAATERSWAARARRSWASTGTPPTLMTR
jgi:hypothetical protein